ncbi:helix-turn-helix transcriptional regulator [Muricauda sp. ANG21]|uniref:helix-turn-helix transcriptional regulator n=1 Tax=Allomuricauda sp. ANG21 TaxID=3042468 RepID=UPI003453E691
MNKGIVTRIKTIIEHYDISVSAFAESIGVQRSSISHLLNGRNKPSLDFVLKLTDAYPDVDLYWLLQGRGEFPSDESKEVEGSPASILENKMEKTETSREEPANSISRPIKEKDEPDKIVFFYPDGTFTTFKSKND